MGLSLTGIPSQTIITEEDLYPNPMPWEAFAEVVVMPEKKMFQRIMGLSMLILYAYS